MNLVTNIDQSNEALKFIDSRISDDKYRGSVSSQHNRYTMDQIIKILSLLEKYAPNNSLMIIRTADISKRPHNTEEEATYALFCNEAKTQAGIGTQDAMRKNLFVDLHRMGLIERYDKNKKPTDPFSKQSIKYVSLTKQGSKLTKGTILDQYFIFSKAIDKLLGGYIDILLEIFRNQEYSIDKITFFEFMFFVSAIGVDASFNITSDKCVKLIKEYRNLSTIQRKAMLETLKTKLIPKNYAGTKTDKRDFHNWVNKVEQIFTILNQTVYFERRDLQLVIRDKVEGPSNKIIDTQLSRSLDEKFQYFNNHDIPEKISGFELHHVVPLSWSESIQQFKIFDKWENMVYIDAYSHAKITQNRNRNVVMSSNGDDIILKDFRGNEVYLNVNKKIAYKIANKGLMLKYNDDLLKTTS